MKTPKDDTDCTWFEEGLLDAIEGVDGRPGRPTGLSSHLETCLSCRSMAEDLDHLHERLDLNTAPRLPDRVLAATITNAREAVVTQVVWQGRTVLKLVVAALIGLPFVVAVNSATGWALYEIFESLLSRPVANYVLVTFLIWTTVGASLTFGSLPFFPLLIRTDTRRRLHVREAA